MGRGAIPVADCIITSIGIDYCTTTTTNNRTKADHIRFFNDLAFESRKLGYALKKAGFHGFYGERTESCLLAYHEDRSLLQVSGEDARRVGILARAGDNCSRLDVQVTIRVAPGTSSKFIGYQMRRARTHRAIRGVVPEVEGRQGNAGWKAFTVGSRRSEIYVRVYDKFLESGEERYKDCVRLEIEYKGSKSQGIWSALGDGSMTLMGMVQLLVRDLSDRGIDVSMIDIEKQDIVRPKAQITKEKRTLGWWASQVAPSVARLTAERGWYTAFSTIFSGCLTEWDRTAIMNSLSVAWGN